MVPPQPACFRRSDRPAAPLSLWPPSLQLRLRSLLRVPCLPSTLHVTSRARSRPPRPRNRPRGQNRTASRSQQSVEHHHTPGRRSGRQLRRRGRRLRARAAAARTAPPAIHWENPGGPSPRTKVRSRRTLLRYQTLPCVCVCGGGRAKKHHEGAGPSVGGPPEFPPAPLAGGPPGAGRPEGGPPDCARRA